MKKDEVTIGELLKMFVAIVLAVMVVYALLVGGIYLGIWLYSIGFWFGTTYIAFLLSIIGGLLGVRELLK